MQSILEVLVGKTVEQALLEVMEEEELAALRQQQVERERERERERESACVCVHVCMCVCML